MKNKAIAFLALLSISLALPVAAQNRTTFAGIRTAKDYAYGAGAQIQPIKIVTGNSATGAQSITVDYGTVVAGDGTQFNPLNTNAKINVGGPANSEAVTPTGVSCSTPAVYATCTFTASFSNTHGNGEPITSATYGLQEAINVQNSLLGASGGIVATDAGWYAIGGTKTILTAIASTTPKVWIWDTSGVGPVWYGKSNSTTGVYSAVNNDMSFQVAVSAGTGTKTLSQTYIVKPNCVGTYVSGTTTGILTIAPTTTTVVVTDSVSEANVVQVNCQLQK